MYIHKKGTSLEQKQNNLLILPKLNPVFKIKNILVKLKEYYQ